MAERIQEIRDTQEQQQAIGTRGRVIVSASAGSGKTYVMIRRLTQLILAGEDVRSVLAVTFTNKAAAQMREKLRTSLVNALIGASEEERPRLKEQLAALPMADISTIHSFCARLLRTYFYLVDLDPAFRIVSGEDAEGRALWDRAMDEVFEHAYEENTAEFRMLLAAFYGRRDDALRAVVKRAYENICDCEDPQGRAARACTFQDATEYVRAYYCDEISWLRERAGQLRDLIGADVKGTEAACAAMTARCDALLSAGSLFAMAELARMSMERSAMPRRTKTLGPRRCALITELSQLFDRLGEVSASLAKIGPEDEEEGRFSAAASLARTINRLAAELFDCYGRLKREAGVLDYGDLERFALRVLENEDALAAVHARYRFVFVDEYQDVNEVQERIVKLVGGEELFLVGDAKQAIYAFRGSNSSYFLRAERELDHALRLSENFRSAPAVIEAVNRVFSRAMTRDIAGVDYAANEMMQGGRRYGEHRGCVHFHRLPAVSRNRRTNEGVYSVREEVTRTPDARSLAVVDLVQQELGKEWFDADTQTMRRVGYSDIAVLAYSVKRTLPENILAALSQYNIPVTSTAETDIRNYFEVQLLIDWLSYLDNAEQDIPLAAAMLSAVGGFDEEELVCIRTAYPAAYAFRTACREYRLHKEDELARRLQTFHALTEELRAMAKVLSAADVIGRLLSLGLEAQFAARQDGEAALARVRRLIEAGACDVTSFLQMIGRTELKTTGTAGGNAVQVLTIHSVKGLEFPVVILVGLDNKSRTSTDKVFFDEKFGTAPACFDFEERKTYDTMLRRALSIRRGEEQRKSDLNVFYVAMTRAKYRLHLLVGTKTETCPARFAGSMAEFIDFEACADYFVEDAPVRAAEPRAAFVYRGDEEEIARIRAVYQRPYRYAESVSLPVKCSATELLQAQPHTAYAAEGGSDREEGTAYHAFLQHVRFGRPAAEELERMRREGLLSAEQLARLDPEQLARMLALPCLRALAGRDVLREQTFLVSLTAAAIPSLGSASADEIVVQGAIDALVREEDGYTILDYKFSGADGAHLAAAYAPQLALYKKAVAKITNTREEKIRARIVNIRRLFEVEM